MITGVPITISPQGQITIPKYIREKLGKNLWLSVIEKDEKTELSIVERPQKWSHHSLGLGEKVWKDVDVDEYIQNERESWD